MKAPCRDCPYRTEDCHKDCGRYKIYQAENTERNRQRLEERSFQEATRDGINRMRRLRSTNGIVSGGKRGRT